MKKRYTEEQINGGLVSAPKYSLRPPSILQRACRLLFYCKQADFDVYCQVLQKSCRLLFYCKQADFDVYCQVLQKSCRLCYCNKRRIVCNKRRTGYFNRIRSVIDKPVAVEIVGRETLFSSRRLAIASCSLAMPLAIPSAMPSALPSALPLAIPFSSSPC